MPFGKDAFKQMSKIQLWRQYSVFVHLLRCVCVWGGGGAAFAGTCERSLDRGVTCKASNPDPTQNKILLFL